MSRANPVDEGLIHAWIEGQLPPDEAARVERLVATDAEWGAAVAEARGLIAAASRALGALDDVPSVARTSSTSSTRSRYWLRSPWLRAAAGIVLVVGVSSAVWMRGDFRAAADAIVVDRAEPTANAPAAGATVAERAPSQTKDSLTKPAANDLRRGAPGDELQRDAALPRARNEMDSSSAGHQRKEANDALRQRAAAPPPAASLPRAAAAPPVVEQRVVGATTSPLRDAVGGASGARADSIRGSGRGGGDRSGAGAVGGVQANAAMELPAKTMNAAPSVDARLAGCWMPISPLARSTEERERAAEGQLESSLVLRFIGGVMTDAAAPSSPAARQEGAQRAAATRVNAPPVAALASGFASRTVVNATVVPAARPDSAFTAEWISQRGRNVATFTVRGDTLRGTSRTLPVDSARAGAPFVAVRGGCPQ